MKITLAIGSNILQQKNIDEARSRLRHLLPGIVFGEAVWTTPIGIHQISRKKNFLLSIQNLNLPPAPDSRQQSAFQLRRKPAGSFPCKDIGNRPFGQLPFPVQEKYFMKTGLPDCLVPGVIKISVRCLMVKKNIV